ncbi:MAG: DNA/RNA non-specific endonuclease [Bacteroidales bacterium]|nr:DNA/RNA non-specific endonuclease [Bacteroidales bacterium]
MAVLTALSCTKPAPVIPEEEFELSLPSPTATYISGSQFLTVKASGEWSLDLDFGEGVQPWLTIDKSSGDKSAAVVMTWQANGGENTRICIITLTSGAKKTEAVFTQSARVPIISELIPDEPRKWLELPAMPDNDGRYFFFHDMNLGSKTVRNYSFYYDPDALISVWVAYPLNKGLIGNGSRTDAWGYDPKLPRDRQQCLSSAYRGGYDRGHQLPSADRLASGANEQTFYFTNMTPQKAALNQNEWASLESKVRTWAGSLDTLYVVTGANIKGSKSYAYDNNNKAVTVPVGYFKALLGYKPGTVGNTTGGYIALGIYYDHYNYSSTMSDQYMTIDELESKLGMDFFVNLSDKIGETLSAQVESKIDAWWTKN